MYDWSLEELSRYKHISKAIEVISSVGQVVQLAYRREAPESLIAFISERSEVLGGTSPYRTRVVYSLLQGELSNKANLADLISQEINDLSDEDMYSLIKDKSQGEKVAYSITVLQDYVSYLRTGKWVGPSSKFKYLDDFNKFLELKSPLQLSCRDLGKNGSIFKDVSAEDFKALASLSPEFLAYELLLLTKDITSRKVD